jgi:LacI family transcriptional regulator
MFPQLSSVSLGSAERGRRAAELLLQRIADPTLPPRREQVAPSLAVRASSAATPLLVPEPAPAPRTPEVTA